MKYLTASEMPTVMGERPNLAKLWAKKRGVSPWPNEEPTEAMVMGTRIEGFIASLAEEKLGEPIRRNRDLYVSITYPFIAATPDGFTLADDVGSLDRIVEFKNVSSFMQHQWDMGPPLSVRIQVHVQMLCTGLRRAIVPVLFGGNTFVMYAVECDDVLMDSIIVKATQFWERCIVGGAFPDDEELHDVVPIVNEKEMTLDAEGEALVHKYMALCEEEKRLDRVKSSVKGAICGIMGEAGIGRCMGYTVKRATRETVYKAQPERVIKATTFKVTETPAGPCK
jgi:predicted phage-related endonuclease